jgi:hypothetical protein
MTQLQLEIVYLRKELEILARTSGKPRLPPSNGFFFSILTDIFGTWKGSLLIGSIRRECLDHLIIVNETHLPGILRSYTGYYNTQRPHLGVSKDSPR